MVVSSAWMLKCLPISCISPMTILYHVLAVIIAMGLKILLLSYHHSYYDYFMFWCCFAASA